MDKQYEYINDEYRWYRNKKDRKSWEQKNPITGEWEFVSFLSNYYGIMTGGYRYCVYCSNKSVRLNYSELSRRDSELGIQLDDDMARWSYDEKRMKELGVIQFRNDIGSHIIYKTETHNLALPYLWECRKEDFNEPLNPKEVCIIKNVSEDVYDDKKDMVTERIKREWNVTDIDTRSKNKRRKDQEKKRIADENEKLWKKFF